MSRGLGRVERAILAFLEEDDLSSATWEGKYAEDSFTVAIYRPPDAPDDFHFKRTRAQYTAVLRAMHSLARKYPESIKLSGGQGREPLWLEYTAETDFEKLLGRR